MCRRLHDSAFTVSGGSAGDLDGGKTLHIALGVERGALRRINRRTGRVVAGESGCGGLEQADTLRMQFSEDNGEVWQWVDPALTFAQPEIIDLREKSNPHEAARALMQADLQQDIRADGNKPLVFHQLIQVGDKRWYWYQRYHHLLVDGFSFPAITRQIAAIYRAWLDGESTPDSPFTPFAEVVEEYQQYRQSDAWQGDGAFWRDQRKQLHLLLRCRTIRCRDARPARILFA